MAQAIPLVATVPGMPHTTELRLVLDHDAAAAIDNALSAFAAVAAHAAQHDGERTRAIDHRNALEHRID